MIVDQQTKITKQRPGWSRIMGRQMTTYRDKSRHFQFNLHKKGKNRTFI